MASDLNIKYGSKTGTGNQIKTGTDLVITPGNIYAARNSLDQVEVYLDTPQKDGETSVRSRLDPRIYVGSVSDILGNIPAGTTQEQINQMETAAVDKIWDNYDVWIDTSGDPTGNATPGVTAATSTAGLMSADAIFGLSQILTELKTLKIQIVTQSYWNSTNNTNQPRNKNDTTHLSGWLTIVVPDSAGENYNATSNPNPKTCLLEWDFSSINVTPQSGGNGS